jgi:colicin import membrane protein
MAQFRVQPDRRSGLGPPAVPSAQAHRRARFGSAARRETIVCLQATASAKQSARASSPEPIVWLLGTASLKAQVAAAEMRNPQAHASAEAVAGLPALSLARPFPAAQSAARLAHPAASARLVGAAEAAVRDAAVEAVQPQAAGRAEAAQSAAQHAAAEAVPHAAAGVAAVAQHAVAEAAAPHAAGVVAAEPASAGAPQRAALALPVLALASAWAFRLDPTLPWPARPPSARFARATAE